MNAYQISAFRATEQSDDFNALILASMLSKDFDISNQYVGIEGAKPLYRNVVTFQTDFSLKNYNPVAHAANTPPVLGLEQLVINSQMTETKEIAFKPYAVKGYKVALLLGNATPLSRVLPDLENEYITFDMVDETAGGGAVLKFVLGTCNSTQNDTYKPFQGLTGLKQIRFFSDSDVIALVEKNSCAVTKPFINPSTATFRQNL